MEPTRGDVRGTIRGRFVTVVTVLLVMLLAVALSTVVARARVQRAEDRVDKVLSPAQRDVAALSRAYVDQESGALGYVLTGDRRFLQPYDGGRRDAERIRRQLGQKLATDPASRQLLDQVDSAARDWQEHSAGPEIAAREAGRVVSSAATLRAAIAGKQRFDTLRQRLDDLDERVSVLVGDQINRARESQWLANRVAAAALLVAALVAIAATLMLRGALTRPLDRLVRQVRQVADGDLEQQVEVTGPRELATLADAVERMRIRILADSASAATAQEELAVYAQSDRIARDLHDVVIQRLFAAGMRLQSLAARQPSASPHVEEIIEDLDRSIRELRTVIFGLTAHTSSTGALRDQVMTLLRDSERTLGFAPALTIDGPVDAATPDHVAKELIPALGESLSNVARHAQARRATVSLQVADGQLRLTVTDDGVGIAAGLTSSGRGLGNLTQRAERLGGTCTVGPGPSGGTTVSWHVPLAADADATDVAREPASAADVTG